MKTYLVFIIQAYNSESPQGQVMDVATVELIDTTVSRALDRAKKIIEKKFYRLSMVIEKVA